MTDPSSIGSSSTALSSFLGVVAADAGLWPDFEALCDFGGRLASSAGERMARDWVAGRLDAIPGGALRRDPVAYEGWTCRAARVVEAISGEELPSVPLLAAAATPPGGLELEVIDCGRGVPEEIEARADAVRGKAVLVRHEYPFASSTIHRRLKLAAAIRAGAAAFLIAQPEPGIGPVSGSAGLAPGRMIPAFGLSAEAAARLSVPRARVRLTLDAQVHPAEVETIVFDLPGRGPDRVVLSAHIDGHALGESALDNATGLAAALVLARAAAPVAARMPRGLTVCVFSAEEWALTGSRVWLDAMPAAELARFSLNLNLDSIAGSPRLTALTSDFPALGPFVSGAATAAGFDLGIYEPLMPNSDHANFAARGVPALRLVAGFDEPDSALRFLLTGADTRRLTSADELKLGTLTAAAILWAAMAADPATLGSLKSPGAMAGSPGGPPA